MFKISTFSMPLLIISLFIQQSILFSLFPRPNTLDYLPERKDRILSNENLYPFDIHVDYSNLASLEIEKKIYIQGMNNNC